MTPITSPTSEPESEPLTAPIIPREEFPALTGIRGIAALLVLLAHVDLELSGDDRWDWPAPKLIFAQPYVDLFFILSGFVISHTSLEGKGRSLGKFFIARFARIYPLHLFTLALSAVLVIALSVLSDDGWPDSLNLRDAVKQLLLVNAMPGFAMATTWVFTSWSISVEWWVYLLVFPVIARIREPRNLKTVVVVVAVVTLGLVTSLLLADDGSRFTRSWIAFGRGATGFVIGWLAWCLYRRSPLVGWWTGRNCTLIGVAAIATIVIQTVLSQSQPWLAILWWPLLVIGLCGGQGLLVRLCATKLMHYLGVISYSVYLIHPIAMMSSKATLVRFMDPGLTAGLAYAAMVIGGSLLVSSITYRFIENPGRRLIRKQAGRILPAKPAPAAVGENP